jgi:hypothetical protein
VEKGAKMDRGGGGAGLLAGFSGRSGVSDPFSSVFQCAPGEGNDRQCVTNKSESF